MKLALQSFEARRHCSQINLMVLLWLGVSSNHYWRKRRRYRFFFWHCECEGNGCNPTLCPVGENKQLRIGESHSEARSTLLPAPVYVERTAGVVREVDSETRSGRVNDGAN